MSTSHSSVGGPPVMDAKYIRDLCCKTDLYLTPELNAQLYLHFKGFTKIGGLDEYTGLKVGCFFLMIFKPKGSMA